MAARTVVTVMHTSLEMRRKYPNSKRSWPRKFEQLWKKFVPASGQANTVQGELIRCIGKLTDEAYRNGNYNWDAGHARMCSFVRKTLSDKTVFQAKDLAYITEAAKELEKAKSSPDTSGFGSCYYYLSEKAVEWCAAHPKLLSRAKDPKLRR